MFDVEAQIVRNDQIGTKYSGQAGLALGISIPTAGGTSGNVTVPANTTANVQVADTAGVGPAVATGRRMGSLNAFAGTHSFNPATA